MRSLVRLAVGVCLAVFVAAWAGADPVFTLADPQVFTKPSRPWGALRSRRPTRPWRA